MKVIPTKQLIILVILSIYVVFTDIVDILYKGSSLTYIDLIHYLTTIVIISLLFVMFRMVYNTSTDLQTTNQRLSNIFDTIDVAIWSHNLKNDKLLITPGIEKLYGYPLEAFYKNRNLWKEVIFEEDLFELEQREKRIKNGITTTSIYRILRPNGEVRWIQDRGIPFLDNTGNIIDFTSVLFDITDLRESKERIHMMAYYDTLTGLPNRNKLREYIANEISSKGSTFSLFLLDLDRFKFVNDTKGHSVGDLILIDVGKRLKKIVGTNGIVFRLSGDEFIVVLKFDDMNKVKAVAESILNEFKTPFLISENEFHLTTSIGISCFPKDGIDQDNLMKNADSAMYLAKELGKNNFQFFTSDLNQEKERKLELENGLRKAIEQNQLTLYYQPQIKLKTNEIYGTEALIRWNHPILGIVPPNEFIPLAEESELIVEIGQWVLRTAIQQTKEWQDDGLKEISIAVNISARQFQDENFIDFVKDTLEEFNLNPKYLELEITESMMQDINNSTIVLNKLKKLGISLAIDDFGTGYSSLSYLKHLPIDIIKIDKSFVDDIKNNNKTDASIVKAIIEMGRSLNFRVIAEGLETEYQANYLIDNFCDLGQGYFYSKPLPSEELKKLL